jgi:amidohydrolase
MVDRMQLIKSISSEATEWRRNLHRHPQTMYEEDFASDFVSKKLTEWGISHERGIARTGVVATIEGRRNRSGRAIAFRADMDALNLTERSGQPWSSLTPGKMHGCGHDGHTATLLTLARYLHQTRNFDGLVRLIFQPAEEGGRGASLMLEEGLLERFPFDEIYGYHNWPSLAHGIFAIRSGPMLAAVDQFEIRLNGSGGHAAMPHLTRDVVPAVAQLVLALQTLVSRETDPIASVVVSVTNISVGSGAFNVISEEARLSGTVRTFRQDIRDHHEARLRAITDGISRTFGVSNECHYSQLIDPVINELQCTLHCRAAAVVIVGKENVLDMEPTMGGEDFGRFLQERPGAFIAIGQAEQHSSSPHNFGLHSAEYDFNDAVIPTATSYFAELAERRLQID